MLRESLNKGSFQYICLTADACLSFVYLRIEVQSDTIKHPVSICQCQSNAVVISHASW